MKENDIKEKKPSISKYSILPRKKNQFNVQIFNSKVDKLKGYGAFTKWIINLINLKASSLYTRSCLFLISCCVSFLPLAHQLAQTDDVIIVIHNQVHNLFFLLYLPISSMLPFYSIYFSFR